MKLRVFVDDVREPPKGQELDTIILRSYEALIGLIEALGLKEFISIVKCISFDNDMGEGRMEGREFVKWWSRRVIETGYCNAEHFPNLKTHSMNPIAAKAIMGYIKDVKNARAHK